MNYRLLGRSGVRVSTICLGTAFFGIEPRDAGVDALVNRAIDLGVNFFDTANSYGNQARFDRPGLPAWHERASSEELLGRALGARRLDVVLATKVQEKVGEGPNDGGPSGAGLSRKHIMQQCERSLRRLGTDYIDVYYAHHPDPTTPLDQTLRAFDDLVHQGKVRFPALSNYPAWQLTRVLWLCDRERLNPPVAMEMPYSLLNRGIETDVVPACAEFGVGITCYSPLAEGLLSGRFSPGQPLPDERVTFRHDPGHAFPAARLAAAARFTALAREWDFDPPVLAIAWLLSREVVASAIVGSASVGQLEQVLTAVDVSLTQEQVAALDAIR